MEIIEMNRYLDYLDGVEGRRKTSLKEEFGTPEKLNKMSAGCTTPIILKDLADNGYLATESYDKLFTMLWEGDTEMYDLVVNIMRKTITDVRDNTR